MPTRRCPICQKDVEATIWPRSWEPDLVAHFQRLEARMACPECDPVPWPDTDD